MHLPPNQLSMHLTLKDVWLDFFINRQIAISELKNGDSLRLNSMECFDEKGNSVLKFSKQFTAQIEKLKAKNFELKSAKVNFVLYWKKEETQQEIKIILPELTFERKTD